MQPPAAPLVVPDAAAGMSAECPARGGQPCVALADASVATPREHFHWIDGLRFVAAAAVMVEHVRAHNQMDWAFLPPAARTGWRYAALIPTRFGVEAVILFFVLSGFLVGGRTIRRVREGNFDLSAYALDRVTRIYVPLVPALLLTLAVSVACGVPVAAGQWFGHLAGLQDAFVKPLALDTPLWTLSYEIWFYVLAGAAAALATSGTRGKTAAFVAVVVSLGMFVPLDAVYLFCWLLGALAHGLIDAVQPWRAWCGWIGATATVAACACYQMVNDVLPAVPPTWREAVPDAWTCKLVLASGLSLLTASLAGAAPATRFGRSVEQLGTRLAAFSYTLYLVHYPLMCLVAALWPDLGGGIGGRFVVRIAFCTAGSAAMYALFEKHTARVRRWLRMACFGTGMDHR